MEAKELRIGNWVQYKDGNTVCIQNGWEIDEGMEIEPIHLTEQWLLKFSFTTFLIDKWDSPQEHENNYHLVKHNDKWIFRGLGASVCEIISVSHLQNLYFFLTGFELEVK